MKFRPPAYVHECPNHELLGKSGHIWFQSFLCFFPGRRDSPSRVFQNYTLRRFCIHIFHLHIRRIKKIKPGYYEFFYKNNVKLTTDVWGAQGRQGSSLWASLCKALFDEEVALKIINFTRLVLPKSYTLLLTVDPKASIAVSKAAKAALQQQYVHGSCKSCGWKSKVHFGNPSNWVRHLWVI